MSSKVVLTVQSCDAILFDILLMLRGGILLQSFEKLLVVGGDMWQNCILQHIIPHCHSTVRISV